MSKLNIRAVRSYRSDKSVILDLSKRINLVYGQNGSGKSTISGYFYKSDEKLIKIALLNVMMNISLLSTIVSLWRIHFIINLNSQVFLP
ncbi:TPA: AAA family ATPase [Klebsiella pneumoniae]|uniref:ATP-binding protein n=1 Tax=Klebsiella pneumoniae TaxID=573 RepID=UPI00227B0FE3|nr:ATP-binding protein [Klebsiella pneumoniae]MCY4782874.1 ATP-binding protein [Klebsiella pneumoniae]HEN5222826.1 AAA family ATPase [Klebsiella pneumoniae]